MTTQTEAEKLLTLKNRLEAKKAAYLQAERKYKQQVAAQDRKARQRQSHLKIIVGGAAASLLGTNYELNELQAAVLAWAIKKHKNEILQDYDNFNPDVDWQEATQELSSAKDKEAANRQVAEYMENLQEQYSQEQYENGSSTY